MLSVDPWQTIQDELSRMLDDNTYSSVRPLLEKFKPVIDAKRFNPDFVNLELEQATAFLEIVKYIQVQDQQGGNSRVLVQQIASGVAFNQPDLKALGNVNQAGRDLIVNIFSNALPSFKAEEPDPRIEVPIVLLVMSASEANELASEACFQGYPEDVRTEFRQLQTLLRENNLADWQQRYGEMAKEWRPFKESQESIEWLLDDVFKRVEGYEKKIVPDFVDIQTLNTNRRLLKKLRNEGCVVIMDVISLRHPKIQHAFRLSLLDAFPKTLVAMVNPIRSDVRSWVQQIMIVIERQMKIEFYMRHDEDEDERCEEVESKLALGRFLKREVKKLLPKKDIQENMYKS